MENYQNSNSQFGGWEQTRVPYGAPNPQGFVPYGSDMSEKRQEERNDKKILGKLGKLFGLAIIFYVACSTIVSIGILFLSKYFPVFNLLYENELANYAYSVIASIIYIGVPFGIVYLILRKKKLAGVLPFGTVYNGKAAIYLTMVSIPAMTLSSMVVNAISLVVQSLLGIEFTSGLEELEMSGFDGFIIGAISMAVVPAIIEEFSIRGVVMQPLRRYGDGFAIVASAFIFSIMHGNMAQIPYTVVGGLYLGYLVIATGSIWPSIIVHFVNNMYSVVILSVDSNFGERASSVAGVIMIGLLIATGVIGGIGFVSMNYKTKLGEGVKTLTTGKKIKALFLNIPMVIAIVVMIFITLTSIGKS